MDPTIQQPEQNPIDLEKEIKDRLMKERMAKLRAAKAAKKKMPKPITKTIPFFNPTYLIMTSVTGVFAFAMYFWRKDIKRSIDSFRTKSKPPAEIEETKENSAVEYVESMANRLEQSLTEIKTRLEEKQDVNDSQQQSQQQPDAVEEYLQRLRGQ